MKTKLHSLFIGLALLAVVHPVLAQPALGIVPTNNQSLLYWPAAATNYILQSSTNLAYTNWVFATDAVPATYGSQTAVTVTNTSLARFFRLYNTNASAIPAGMALIPAGSFTMGNSIGDSDITDASTTNVTVSAFYMDVNLVSFSQWTNVYVYAINRLYNFVHAGLGKAGNNPVQTVDWFDCVKWSNARSQQAALTPVYYTDADFTQVFTNGDTGTTVYQNLAANGYRLPTEAEWEKAARGGLSGQRFPWGNTISESQANYRGETASYSYDLGPDGYNPIGNYPTTSPGTSPVGSFAPNGYGLYDMAGNVFEWCWDWYGTPYGQPTTNNPTGAGPGSGLRVLRGGWWFTNASAARCAFRTYGNPSTASDVIGFRCVRGL